MLANQPPVVRPESAGAQVMSIASRVSNKALDIHGMYEGKLRCISKDSGPHASETKASLETFPDYFEELRNYLLSAEHDLDAMFDLINRVEL